MYMHTCIHIYIHIMLYIVYTVYNHMLHTYCINLSPIPFHPRFGILNESLGTSFEGRMLGKFWGDKLTNSSQKVATNMGIFTPRKLTAGNQQIGRFVDVSPFLKVYFFRFHLSFFYWGEVVLCEALWSCDWKASEGSYKNLRVLPSAPPPRPQGRIEKPTIIP